MPLDLENYVGPQYEYCTLVSMMGTAEANWQNPSIVIAQGVTVEATDPVEAINELGRQGWQVDTSTKVDLPDLSMGAYVFVIHTLRRPL